MTEDRWREVERIFHEALALSGNDRRQFVESTCAPDHELIREVMDLLDAHELPGTFEGDEAAVLASELLSEKQFPHPPGRTLSHYRIVRPLGVGGMGEVYLAADSALDRLVALKVLKPDLSADPMFLIRFAAEARAASALNHSNIATIYELGEADGTRFIAMEYVQGETLEARIARGPMPHECIRDVALQIASALEEAHGKGILHRDIKPSNLMITPKGQVKLLDFGLARLLTPAPVSGAQRLTATGTVMGTYGYMSPEQLTGKDADCRSDIFSYGTVLFEMATGRAPFTSTTVGQTLANVLQAEPDISGFEKLGPAWLWAVVRRCLRKDREERYQSVAELRQDLEARIAGVNPIELTISRRWLLAGSIPVAGLLGTVAWRLIPSRVVKPSGIRSLAVLPLANLAGTPEQEYFSDGMTDALIGELGRIENLRVISRTSVMRYKSTQVPLRKIAQQLTVDGVVEGAVLRSADRIRISVRLVDATEDRQLWSQSFEGAISDVFEFQREVAREVAHRISQRLAGDAGEVASADRAVQPEAYDSYLRGRFHWSRRTRVDVEKAMTEFEQTIRLAPRYAPAYVGLADCYNLLPPFTGMPPWLAYPKSESAARSALEIDDHLGEAHAALGVVLHEFYWDHPSAESHFKRAIEWSPNYAAGHQWYAEFLMRNRRRQEGVERMQQALRLDPVSLPVNAITGWVLNQAGRRKEASAQLEKTIALDPTFILAHGYLVTVLMAEKRWKDAITESETAFRLSNGAIRYRAGLAMALALSGRRSDAQKHLATLIQLSATQYVPKYLIAVIHMTLGNREQALVWIEQAAGERGVWSLLANIDPAFEPLRGDPRFRSVLRTLGFPG